MSVYISIIYKILMTGNTAYVNATIIAGIIAAMVVSATLLTTTSSWAATQKKNVSCAGEKHTRNYCDGYYLGIADCKENADKDRSNSKHHTKDWRDGYKRGFNYELNTHGCYGDFKEDVDYD
ncbi:MAG: hypothetical protein WBX01_11180 [Nitrososphaeraceae archaeon]